MRNTKHARNQTDRLKTLFCYNETKIKSVKDPMKLESNKP